MCTGKAWKEALPTWRVLGPWQQVEGALALPDIGLAEAGLGLERRVWVGAGDVVAKEPSIGVAGPCLEAGEPATPSPSVLGIK